jgi:putative heme utilization carrier protein HutX
MTTLQANEQDLREQIALELERNPGQFTGGLARRYGVTEAEVLRAHPEALCTELDPERIEALIHSLEKLETVMVLCSNEGAILEANGKFGGFSSTMGFINVLTDTLDMHITAANIKAAFALIKKPHVGGEVSHSIQFFSERGTVCFKVFVLDYLDSKVGEDHTAKVATWKALRDEFRLDRQA